MTSSETLQPTETMLGRAGTCRTPAKSSAAKFSALFSGACARERFQRQPVWKIRTFKMGGTAGQRVGGNDPGFGRTVPPKPAQTQSRLRGSFPPTRFEVIRRLPE